MAGRLTVKERAQIAARYEVRNSVVAVQRWWRTVRGRNTTIRPETIKSCHSKLLTTGSVTDAQRSDHPSTSRSVDSIPGRLRKLVDAAGAYVDFKVMHQYSHLKRYM